MNKRATLMAFAAICLLGVYNAAADAERQNGDKKPFSHKQHVVVEELECLDCHAQAVSSITGVDDLLPAMAICMDCHEDEPEKIENPELLPRVNSYSQKFSHAAHAAEEADCATCHSAILEEPLARNAMVLPDMLACMECHQQQAVSVECASCHMAFEELRPISHRQDFLHHHGLLARAGARKASADMDCVTCHKPSFCQECHEGDNIDRFAHPLNYEFTHALEAQAKEKECAVCHTERQFCFDCHRDNQVLPHNHTVGWVNNFPDDGGRHRIEALNDLDACIACHEQNAEQFCQPCHAQ